jgi:hypothetical protein
LFVGLVSMQPGAFLATFVVVGYDHRVLVEHRGLETAVGADERAGLFAEAREDGIEQEREEHHKGQPDEVIAWVVGLDGEELIAADDVGEEGVADYERQAEEDGVLERLLEYLPRVPRSGVESVARENRLR